MLRNRGQRRNVELRLAKSGRALQRRRSHFLAKLLGEERMIRGPSGDSAESQYSWTWLGNPSILGLGIEGGNGSMLHKKLTSAFPLFHVYFMVHG